MVEAFEARRELENSKDKPQFSINQRATEQGVPHSMRSARRTEKRVTFNGGELSSVFARHGKDGQSTTTGQDNQCHDTQKLNSASVAGWSDAPEASAHPSLRSRRRIQSLDRL